MEEITIEIHNGEVKISVKGAKGPGCKALTADIEKSLGGVKDRQLTSEYRAATASTANKAVQR